MSFYAAPAALNADCYKSGHIRQYPEGTEYLLFNMTPRSDKYFNTPLSKTGMITFGIERFINDYLVEHWNKSFFHRPKAEVLEEINKVMNGMLGDGAVSLEHWGELHDLGFLPISVAAVPEGTLLPMKVPMLSFTNTIRGFAWVAGYLEDTFSNENWKACTIATLAFHYSRICKEFADITCDDHLHLPWQCHDFALRGMSGMNDGALNSMAHLTSFMGTDDFAAVYTMSRTYGNGMDICEIAGSVPATEHSVMTTNILLKVDEMLAESVTKTHPDSLRGDAEKEVFKHFLQNVYPTGIVSLVSDSFNYWRTIGEIASKLREVIIERDGKVVFRPDSGNPFHVVCGYKAIEFENAKAWLANRFKGLQPTQQNILSAQKASELPYLDCLSSEAGYEVIVSGEDFDGADVYDLQTRTERYMTTEEINGSIKTLWDTFGGKVNTKGYKVLDPHVGLIYGDSITLDLANKILSRMEEMGFASSNIVFGVGSYTYQYITRDTFGMAVKATYAEVNGKSVEVCKEPITDLGLKKSAKGGVVPLLNEDTGEIYACDGLNLDEYYAMINSTSCLYEPVFYNGEVLRHTDLNTIRQRIDSYI